MEGIGERMLGEVAVILVGAMLTIVAGVITPVLKTWLERQVLAADATLAVKEQESGIQLRWMIKELMRDAVRIAEQAGVNKWIADIGREKKKYAVEWTKAQMAKQGLPNLPVEEISDMIEAAYHEIFKEITTWDELEPPVLTEAA